VLFCFCLSLKEITWTWSKIRRSRTSFETINWTSWRIR